MARRYGRSKYRSRRRGRSKSKRFYTVQRGGGRL